MHIAFATYGGRVAKLLGDLLDCSDHIPFRLGLAVVCLELRQRERRQHCSRPGSKILGAEILPRDFLDVVVDVAGTDGARFSVVVQIFEELVSWNFRAALHDGGNTPVLDPKLPLLA